MRQNGDLFASNSPFSQAQQYNLAEIGRQLDYTQQLDSTPSKFPSPGLPKPNPNQAK